MMVTTNGEFARKMVLLARSSSEFEATATYDRDGDCVEFLAKPDPFLAERIDDLVTVYYSQETGEVIGSLTKGVSSFCKRMLEANPGFRLVIEKGRVRLEHLFLARLWSLPIGQPTDLITLTYRSLIDMADKANIDVDAGLATAYGDHLGE